MLAPFLKIVVDKKEEQKFRDRALTRYPREHMEALWGYVRGDTAYICAFIKIELKNSSSRSLSTPEGELDEHEEDALEAEVYDSVEGRRVKLEFLGTIHTHPDSDDAVMSEHDVRDSLKTQESIMGVCAISVNKITGRRRTVIDYWPALRPLTTERKVEYESSSAKTSRRRAKRKSNRKSA